MDSSRQPTVLYLIACVALISSVVIRPTPWRCMLWLVVAGLCAWIIFASSTGDPVADCSWGSTAVGTILMASDWILLNTPQVEFRQIGQETPIYTASASQRIIWAIRLFTAQRCIGWTHEPKGVFRDPPLPSTTRRRFVLHKLAKIALYVCVIDVCSIYNRTNPSFYQGGPPLESRPFVFRVLDLFSFAAMSRSSLSAMHASMSIVSVVLGFSKPQDWRPLFGNWTDAYTIRRFWGRVWHQGLRRSLSSHGTFFARRVLGLKSGSKLLSFTQLFVAFFLSALIHIVADNKLLGQFGLQHSWSHWFFMLQFVGIVLEDFFIWLGSQLGLNNGWKGWYCIGYVTTMLWFLAIWPRWMIGREFIPLSTKLPISTLLEIWAGQREMEPRVVPL